MKHLTTTEARSHFSNLLSEVEYRNETYVLRRHNRDVAAVVPMEALQLLRDLLSDSDDVQFANTVAYAEVRQHLGLSDRAPDAARGRSLIALD